MMMQTRIAAVSYLNTIPFIYGIEYAGADLHAALLLSPPRSCAEALRSAQADIALIPVAAIPDLSGIRIVTPFCIGASGSVRTVILAGRTPVEKMNTVYLDSHSMTSVRLARILADEHWNIHPRWEELTDYSLIDSAPENAGFILIGDKVFEHEDKFVYKYDLADEWRRLTGLPFTFAAWVARDGIPAETVSTLETALHFGIGHIPEAIGRYGYASRPYALDYLTRNIDFVFDAQKRRAMELYWTKGMKTDPPIQPG